MHDFLTFASDADMLGMWGAAFLLLAGFALLMERRRMKRNELHYIDHPAMGILIKITALDEDALESWAEAELMQSEDWPASLRTRAAP